MSWRDGKQDRGDQLHPGSTLDGRKVMEGMIRKRGEGKGKGKRGKEREREERERCPPAQEEK